MYPCYTPLLLSKLFLWLEKVIQAEWPISHGLSNNWCGSWDVSAVAWSLEQKTFRGWSLIGVNQRCGRAHQMRRVRADRWGAVKITQSIEEVEKLILCIDVFHFTWRTSPKGNYGVNRVTVFVCGKQKVSQLPRNCWRNVKMSIFMRAILTLNIQVWLYKSSGHFVQYVISWLCTIQGLKWKYHHGCWGEENKLQFPRCSTSSENRLLVTTEVGAP